MQEYQHQLSTEQTQIVDTLREIPKGNNWDTLRKIRRKLDKYHEDKNNNTKSTNNIHIHGPAGSGKTYLALILLLKN